MFAAPGKLRDQATFRFRQEVDAEVQKFREEHEYVLFQERDTWMWIIFAIVFVALILFDNLVLHRSHEVVSLTRALVYTAFWMFCGACWGVAVYFHRGTNAAINWATAYMLEWMLSIDCLFFFHIIFKIFSTPDHLKHKPLFYGICGAIVFRMIFFSIEEVIIHSSFWAHMIFGAFLVYTGIKSATMGEEQFDPRENVVFKFICNYVPLLNGYHDDGYFFVKVPVCIQTGKPLIELVTLSGGSARKSNRSTRRSNSGIPSDSDAEKGAGTQRSTESEKPPPVYTDADLEESIATFTPRRFEMRWRATLLLMVVLCLEVTDLIFAVDSVSAIVAEVPDLFLAYTASVFAMLGLRAMFFVTDELMHLFTLLKYGIAAILVIIGLKLMLSHWVHIHPLIMLAVLVSIFALSILGSLCLNMYRNWQGDQKKGGEPETQPDQ
jgi:TerC family integral membrane protein